MANSILDLPLISRIRRNHGLEHATMHILGETHPNTSFAGNASPFGFIIFGNVTSEEVADAAVEALKKLRTGHKELATHPNCGTNYTVPGLAVGLAAWLGTLGTGKKLREKAERLPLVIMLATVALVLTRSLGPAFQKKITTSGDPGRLELDRVETSVRLGMRMHRVVTKG